MTPTVKYSLVAAALVVATLVTALVLPSRARAEPVLSVLLDGRDEAARGVFTDLQRLWQFRDQPSSHRLAQVSMADALRRMRAVHRGRGHFAVVDARTAGIHLPRMPSLRVLAVLWGQALHVLTRSTRLKELGVPVTNPVWLMPGTGYLKEALWNLTGNRPEGQQRVTLVRNPIGDELDLLRTDVLVLSASVPDEALREALSDRRSGLRLLPLSDELLDELQLLYPWLLRAGLKRNHYPSLKRGIEVPVMHQLLLARYDIPEAGARKMLESLYRAPRPLRDSNLRVNEIKRTHLTAINGRLPLHPVTRKMFGMGGDPYRNWSQAGALREGRR